MGVAEEVNFLAHLWLADRTGTSMAGAILGDVVRGADLSAYPADIALGIRLHRRVDAATDRHPLIVAARTKFPEGARRYAGILLDLANDYVLSQQWNQHASEPLTDFTARAGLAIAAAKHHFERNGARAPSAVGFSELLRSYGDEAGMDRAIARTALRLKQPEKLLQAAPLWRDAARALATGLPLLLEDLRLTVLNSRISPEVGPCPAAAVSCAGYGRNDPPPA